MDHPKNPGAPLTGDIDDHIADTNINYTDTSGICFCLTMHTGTSHTLFADKKLTIFLEGVAAEKKSLPARVLGLRYFPDKHKVCLMAGFTEPCDFENYTVESIALSL